MLRFLPQHKVLYTEAQNSNRDWDLAEWSSMFEFSYLVAGHSPGNQLQSHGIPNARSQQGQVEPEQLQAYLWPEREIITPVSGWDNGCTTWQCSISDGRIGSYNESTRRWPGEKGRYYDTVIWDDTETQPRFSRLSEMYRHSALELASHHIIGLSMEILFPGQHSITSAMLLKITLFWKSRGKWIPGTHWLSYHISNPHTSQRPSVTEEDPRCWFLLSIFVHMRMHVCAHTHTHKHTHSVAF